MASDFTDIAAQERDRLDAKERIKLAAKLEEEDIKWLASSKRGRRIIYRFLERAGVWQLSFDTNALKMAFAEGRRNEGNALLAQIHKHCPDRYMDIIKEHAANDD